MKTPALTLAEQAYSQLKHKILAAEIKPDTQLRLISLKESLGVGYTPLREALMRLSSEGFVTAEGQRGFKVAPISLEEFKEITAARVAIEELLLKEALVNGDENWEALIVGNYHRLSRRERIDPETKLVTAEWDNAHKQFHSSLIDASANSWLKHFWEILFDQAYRYRQIAVMYGYEFRDDQKEHELLLEHILSRDIPEALKISAQHITGTFDVASKVLKNNSIGSS